MCCLGDRESNFCDLLRSIEQSTLVSTILLVTSFTLLLQIFRSNVENFELVTFLERSFLKGSMVDKFMCAFKRATQLLR